MTTLSRAADTTRATLVRAAFEEIYQQGFRNASLENILGRTGVTKGALYHHFPNKIALGYAVVDEVILPHAAQKWSRLRDEQLDPIDTLLEIGLQEPFPGEHEVSLGCPINNLAQEMAALDEGFRERLHRILDQWRASIQGALERGQRDGVVRPDLNAGEAAMFIVASFEGAYGVAKCANSAEILQTCLSGLANYVESLRVTEATPGAAGESLANRRP